MFLVPIHRTKVFLSGHVLLVSELQSLCPDLKLVTIASTNPSPSAVVFRQKTLRQTVPRVCREIRVQVAPWLTHLGQELRVRHDASLRPQFFDWRRHPGHGPLPGLDRQLRVEV